MSECNPTVASDQVYASGVDRENDGTDEIQDVQNLDGRRNALTIDTNIELILAGRIRKHSIDIPAFTKPRHKVVERLYIDVDKDFRHLLGEVTSEKYNIHGRPEFDLIEVSYKQLLSEGVLDPQPYVRLLFYSSQSTFVISQKVEDRLLFKLREMPEGNDLVIRSSTCTFGKDGRHHEFNTLDRNREKLWRRFLREFIKPQLLNEKRMAELDLRLRKNLVFIEEPLSDDNSSTTTSVKPLPQKKKPSRKTGSGRGRTSADNHHKHRAKNVPEKGNSDSDSSGEGEEEGKRSRPSSGKNARPRPGSGRDQSRATHSAGGRPGSASKRGNATTGSAVRPVSASKREDSGSKKT